jgi:type 1 fimbria pilin
MMKSLKAAALLLALLAAPAVAQGDSVSGTWKVTGDVVGNAVDVVCTFTQDGKKLTGTCKPAGAEKASDAAGEVSEKKVTWKFDTQYEGQPITLTFTGTLGDNSQLKGDIDVQPYNVSGTFEAKKEEPKKPQQ